LPLYPMVFVGGAIRRYIYHINDTRSILKIFIIHFGAIGDQLMATPAIRALDENFPTAKITVMTGSRPSKAAYINNPRINNVFWLQQFDAGNIKYVFKKKHHQSFDLFHAFICYPILVIKTLISGYDLGINLCLSGGCANFVNLLMFLCGIPRRMGAGISFYSELLTLKERKDMGSLKEMHWVDVYLDIMKPLGIKVDKKDLEFYISETDEAFAINFLEAKNITAKDFLIGIHPGGNIFINSKRWPVEKFAAVINKLWLRHNFKVLVFGLKDDEQLVNTLINLLSRETIPILDFSLGKVAAVLRRLEVLLTNDNGILHLADAMEVPHIVSIFGPTEPKRIAPRNERNIYILSKAECAPCIEFEAGDESKRCFKKRKGECLERITVEEVHKELNEILDKLILIK